MNETMAPSASSRRIGKGRLASGTSRKPRYVRFLGAQRDFFEIDVEKAREEEKYGGLWLLCTTTPYEGQETALRYQRGNLTNFLASGRRSARCDKAYSLKPLRQRARASVGYAFSQREALVWSVRLVTAASPRPKLGELFG